MTEPTVWWSAEGSGDALVVIHPGGTDSRAMEGLIGHLGGYRIVRLDLPGHGHSPDIDGSWSFEGLAEAVATVVLAASASPVHIVGWSDGAIVGLHLARQHPELVRSLVFGAGVFDRSGWNDGVLDGSPPQFMEDAYAEISPDGREHWPVVVAKSAALHAEAPSLTVAELADLTMPILVVAGDDDEVRLEHLVELYRALPDGELAIIPRATHGAIVEKPELLARLVRDFHAAPRSNGVAPIRRAPDAD